MSKSPKISIKSGKGVTAGVEDVPQSYTAGSSGPPSAAASRAPSMAEDLISVEQASTQSVLSILMERLHIDVSPDKPVKNGQQPNFIIHQLMEMWRPQLTQSYRHSAKGWASAEENLTYLRECCINRAVERVESCKRSGLNLKDRNKERDRDRGEHKTVKLMTPSLQQLSKLPSTPKLERQISKL